MVARSTGSTQLRCSTSSPTGCPSHEIDNSSTLVRWMIELRPSAKHHGQLQQWQHLVDTLVAGGYTRLAPYSVLQRLSLILNLGCSGQ